VHPVGVKGWFGGDVHLLKEHQPLQGLGTLAQSLGIEDSAFGDPEFAADDVVPGAGIALDRDPVDIDQVALGDLKGNVHPVARRCLDGCRPDAGEGIAGFGIVVGDFEDILPDLLPAHIFLIAHGDEGKHFLLIAEQVAGKIDGADAITRAFFHHEFYVQPFLFLPDLRFADFGFKKTVIIVIADNPLGILLDLVHVQQAGVGKPGHEPFFPGLDLAEEFAVGKSSVALYRDFLDIYFFPFIYLEQDIGTLVIRIGDGGGYLAVVKSLGLVKLPDRLFRFADFDRIENELFLDVGGRFDVFFLQFIDAFKNDGIDERFLDNPEKYFFAGRRIADVDLHIVEVPHFIYFFQVVAESGLVVSVTGFGLYLAQDGAGVDALVSFGGNEGNAEILVEIVPYFAGDFYKGILDTLGGVDSLEVERRVAGREKVEELDVDAYFVAEDSEIAGGDILRAGLVGNRLQSFRRRRPRVFITD